MTTVQAQKDPEGERDQLRAERDQLKVQMEGFRASLVKAHEEAVHEYRANFKETNDYLDLLNDTTEEYKALLKRVNPNFDTEHYDRLILELEEPQTPTPKDPVRFEKLDLIETSGNMVGPSIVGENAEASSS